MSDRRASRGRRIRARRGLLAIARALRLGAALALLPALPTPAGVHAGEGPAEPPHIIYEAPSDYNGSRCPTCAVPPPVSPSRTPWIVC